MIERQLLVLTAQAGAQYTAVAEESGGLVESICSSDFGAIAEALGDGAVEWPTRFVIQAVQDSDSVRV